MNTYRVTDQGKVDTEVSPRGTLELLSQHEVGHLADSAIGDTRLFELFRRCALAVLNTGNECDDAARLFDQHHDFDIEIVKRTRGLKLKIKNAPRSAFVDRRIIEGIRQHLFAVLRDLVYIGTEVEANERFDLTHGASITDAVFHILKQAGVLQTDALPNLVVCWGGHAISVEEYEYTKKVGYHLGLRGLDICTGCGPGAMKGPMKGAAIGHAKQRVRDARFVGLSEPGIIAAEPPNPIVSQLVILPDIEKRLEAFVRLGHAIAVFPGGVGTAEEILYLLGILMHPDNEESPLPLVFTGPHGSEAYFQQIDRLVRMTLGEAARRHYRVIIGDAEAVARRLGRRIREVRSNRRKSGDAFYFNWLLRVGAAYQAPFEVNHDNVAKLRLGRDMPPSELAANLRCMFSALVTGNVKEHGIRLIQRAGPFEIRGEPAIMRLLDEMLASFVAQGRMKLRREEYEACYRIVGER